MDTTEEGLEFTVNQTPYIRITENYSLYRIPNDEEFEYEIMNIKNKAIEWKGNVLFLAKATQIELEQRLAEVDAEIKAEEEKSNLQLVESTH